MDAKADQAAALQMAMVGASESNKRKHDAPRFKLSELSPAEKYVWGGGKEGEG